MKEDKNRYNRSTKRYNMLSKSSFFDVHDDHPNSVHNDRQNDTSNNRSKHDDLISKSNFMPQSTAANTVFDMREQNDLTPSSEDNQVGSRKDNHGYLGAYTDGYDAYGKFKRRDLQADERPNKFANVRNVDELGLERTEYERMINQSDFGNNWKDD